MRQLSVPGVMFDLQQDVAIDQQRMADWRASQTTLGTETSAVNETKAVSVVDDAPSLASVSETIDDKAGQMVRALVESAPGPVHFSTVAQMLRKELPELAEGWGGALTLAAFLKRIDLGQLQRALLENGTTAVLYDPTRHEAPTGVVGDKLIAGMLRAAEVPEIKGSDLASLLTVARLHMGTAEHFEISSVSRSVAEAMTVDGIRTSPRRVTAVLQALIFGGLDATQHYKDRSDLLAAALGVILSAWERETLTKPDEDSRRRLVSWLGLE